MADAKPEEDFLIRRVRRLRDDRADTQKKEYTQWVNSFLTKENMEVNDLFADLADGVKLLKLLEVLSGEKLGRPNQGRQKVHRMDNVNRCLDFLRKKKIAVVGVSVEEFVAGDPRSILAVLGRVVTERNKLTHSKDPLVEDGDDLSYKRLLLQWCQKATAGYRGLHLTNFTSSWRNGLAFNALLHGQWPDCVDYETLDPSCAADNLTKAFDAAYICFGIPKGLRVEDVDRPDPDENAIVTYVALLYRRFHEIDPTHKSNVETPIRYKTEKIVLLEPVKAPTRGPPTRPKTVPRLTHDRVDGVAPSRPADDAPRGKFEGSWECDDCTYENTPSTGICAVCFRARPRNPSTPANAETAEVTPEAVDGEDGRADEKTNAVVEEDDTDSSPSSLETVVEVSAPTETTTAAAAPARDETEDRSTATDDPFERSDVPSVVPDDEPYWRCPGCKHHNSETSRICGFCFRTLRQLKSLSFEEMGIVRDATRALSGEDDPS